MIFDIIIGFLALVGLATLIIFGLGMWNVLS